MTDRAAEQARALAVEMARSWLAALDLDCPGDVVGVPEPLVAMLLPLAEYVTGRVAELEVAVAAMWRRLDAHAAVLAAREAGEAERGGEFDAVLADGLMRLEEEFLQGGRQRREMPNG